MSIRISAAIAAVVVAAAIAVPAVAWANGPTPAPSAPSASAKADPPAHPVSPLAPGLADRLGISVDAAQHVIEQFGKAGADPYSQQFADIAASLGVTPTQLADALTAAKQSWTPSASPSHNG